MINFVVFSCQGTSNPQLLLLLFKHFPFSDKKDTLLRKGTPFTIIFHFCFVGCAPFQSQSLEDRRTIGEREAEDSAGRGAIRTNEAAS